jgi:hypothetical protein
LTSDRRGGRIVPVEDAQQRRVAENEATSRYVNEALDAHSPGERRSPGAFVCECGRRECDRVIEITPRAYERIRAHPRRFIVYPGHEEPEVETIVQTGRGLLVVEKEDEAARIAEAENPRG